VALPDCGQQGTNAMLVKCLVGELIKSEFHKGQRAKVTHVNIRTERDKILDNLLLSIIGSVVNWPAAIDHNVDIEFLTNKEKNVNETHSQCSG